MKVKKQNSASENYADLKKKKALLAQSPANLNNTLKESVHTMFLTRMKPKKKKSQVSVVKKRKQTSGGGPPCFMCNSRAKGGISVHSLTDASRVRYHQILTDIATSGDIVFLIDDDGVICQYCVKLVNCLDRYHSEISIIDKILKNSLHKKYNLESSEVGSSSLLQQISINDVDFKEGETVKVSTGPYMLPEELFEEKKVVRKSISKAPKLKVSLQETPPKKRRRKELKLSDSESEDYEDTGFCQIVENKSTMEVIKGPKTIVKPSTVQNTPDQPSYKCNICFYETNYQSLMIFHLRQHLNSSDLRCDFCNIYLDNNMNMSKEKVKRECDRDMETLEKTLNDTCNHFLGESIKSRNTYIKNVEQDDLLTKNIDPVIGIDSHLSKKPGKAAKVTLKESFKSGKGKAGYNEKTKMFKDKGENINSEIPLLTAAKIENTVLATNSADRTSQSSHFSENKMRNRKDRIKIVDKIIDGNNALDYNITPEENICDVSESDLNYDTVHFAFDKAVRKIKQTAVMLEKVNTGNVIQNTDKSIVAEKDVNDFEEHSPSARIKKTLALKRKLPESTRCITKGKEITLLKKSKVESHKNVFTKNKLILSTPAKQNNLKRQNTKFAAGKRLKATTEEKVLPLKKKPVSPQTNLKVKKKIIHKRTKISTQRKNVPVKTKKNISKKISSTQNSKPSPKKAKALLQNDADYTDKKKSKFVSSKEANTNEEKYSVIRASDKPKKSPKPSTEKKKVVPITQKIKLGMKSVSTKSNLGEKSLTAKAKLVVPKTTKKTKITPDSSTRKTKSVLKTTGKTKLPKASTRKTNLLPNISISKAKSQYKNVSVFNTKYVSAMTKKPLSDANAQSKKLMLQSKSLTVKNMYPKVEKTDKISPKRKASNAGSSCIKKVKLSALDKKSRALLTKKHAQKNQIMDVLKVLSGRVPVLKLEKLKLETL